jgi:hypothetical protein
MILILTSTHHIVPRGEFGPRATWAVALGATQKSSCIYIFSAKKSSPKYISDKNVAQKTSCLQRLSLALAASLSRSSHENTGSSNYFANLRACASYVASGTAASLQSSIALHAFKLHGSGKDTRQQPPRRPGGL